MSDSNPSRQTADKAPASDHFVIRNFINIAFILLTIATIVVFFVWRTALGGYLYICLGMVAVVIKMIEVSIRINFNRKNK